MVLVVLGVVFCSDTRSNGKATTATTTKKPPPGPPKPPGNLVRVEKLTRAISGEFTQLSAWTIPVAWQS